MERLPKYGFFEARFSAAFVGNPFDIPFAAEVVGPDGRKKIVSGFYDGETEFVFRFMPEAEGEYRYTTKSTAPQLDGQSGSFLCIWQIVTGTLFRR